MNSRPWLLAAALTLGAFSPVSAQSTNAPDPAHAPMPPSVLDNDDMARLTKVRTQVLAAHPELQAEETKLKARHAAVQGQTPTADERKADLAEWKDYRAKMRAEMLKLDPTLQPIFEKLDAARKNGAK